MHINKVLMSAFSLMEILKRLKVPQSVQETPNKRYKWSFNEFKSVFIHLEWSSQNFQAIFLALKPTILFLNDYWQFVFIFILSLLLQPFCLITPITTFHLCSVMTHSDQQPVSFRIFWNMDSASTTTSTKKGNENQDFPGTLHLRKSVSLSPFLSFANLVKEVGLIFA